MKAQKHRLDALTSSLILNVSPSEVMQNLQEVETPHRKTIFNQAFKIQQGLPRFADEFKLVSFFCNVSTWESVKRNVKLSVSPWSVTQTQIKTTGLHSKKITILKGRA